MAMVRMDVHTLVVGGGPVSSLVVLKEHGSVKKEGSLQLPIKIGMVEAAAIGMGLNDDQSARPITHDLLASVISSLRAKVERVEVVRVSDTTFFAQLCLRKEDGELRTVDCRPSDGIALALRADAPIYVEESVIRAASLPDFLSVREEEQNAEIERFHDFLEGISPDDFLAEISASDNEASDDEDVSGAPDEQ